MESIVMRWPQRLFLVLLVTATIGCGSVQSSNPSGRDFRKVRSFYVLQHERSDLDKPICEELQKLGFDASRGPENTIPPSAEVLVTFEYNWTWDMTMYLQKLEIHFRDPKSRNLLAAGSSEHDSLGRKDPNFVAHEILARLIEPPSRP